MGRGEKFCSCGVRAGVRQYNCFSCGKGFTIQGIKQPDIKPKTIVVEYIKSPKSPKSNNIQELPKPSKVITKSKNIKKKLPRDKISQYIKKCSDENELSKYKKVWESLNGHYRIRLSPTMFEISMSPFGKFQLLEFCLDYWKPIDRFTTLKQAVDYFVKKDKKHII